MILFLLFGFIFSEFQKNQTYSVSIKSKYAGIQNIDSYLFYLSQYSCSSIHKFLLKLCLDPSKISTINDLESLSSILLHDRLSSNSSLSLLHSYIELNYYLPYGEMIRSIAAEINVKSIETIKNDGFFFASKASSVNLDIIKYYETNFTQRFENDILLNEYSSDKTDLFIYADISHLKSQEIILSILSNRKSELNNKFNLILRPLSPPQHFPYLRGYGVEMKPIKSTVPVVNEDKIQVKEVTLRHDSTTDLIKEDMPSDYLNYSEINLLGPKFTQYLMNQKQNNGNTTSIKLLRDIANNLPVFLRRISETGFSSTSQEFYDKLSMILQQLQHSQAVFTVNGRISSVNNFDAFSFLDLIQEELLFSDILKQEYNISHDVIFNKNYQMDDQFYLDFRDKHIIWNTNFEDKTNPRYSDWSTKMSNPFKLRKNLLNYVIYLDLTNLDQLSDMYKLYALSELPYLKGVPKESFKQTMPIRFGILPFYNLGKPMSRRVSFAFAHLALNNPLNSIQFIAHAYSLWFAKSKKSPNEPLKESYFAEAYSVVKQPELLEWEDIYLLYGQDSNEYRFIKHSNEHFKSIGVDLGTLMLNGKQVFLSDNMQDLIKNTQQMLISITQICQKQGYDDLSNIDLIDDILSHQFMFVTKLDKDIVSKRKQRPHVFGTSYTNQMTFIKAMNSIEWNYKDDVSPRSYFVLFTNHTNETKRSNEIFEGFAKNQRHITSTAFATNPTLLRKFLGINENDTALFINGILYQSVSLTNVSQLDLIDQWSHRFIVSYFDRYMNQTTISFESLLYLTSVIADWKSIPIQRLDLNELIQQIENINDNPLFYNDNNKGIELVLLIDPFTKDFQKISDFLYYISNVRQFANLKLLLIPPDAKNQYELDTYYRYATNSNEVVFSMLNDTTSYFTQLITPPSWNIETLSSTEGIDSTNIRMEQYSSDLNQFNVFAEYFLRSIVVEGRCYIDGISAPQFLELGLYQQRWQDNNFTTVKVDETYAMPTLSYFQFNADPGVYTISAASQTSTEMYVLNDPRATMFDIGSFSKKEYLLHGKIKLANHKDYIRHLQNKSIESKKMMALTNKTKDHINIFTIPHGKYHERLAKVMILSVLQNTQSKVTFYLLRSFLSPAFKVSLQKMAEDYHFDYQLIDFKWPSWLHKETEPQRMTMGEKILFLDQLFPLNLDKIIYIDSDQIVRTDLQELMDMQFSNNAPYAFPPYCNSRPEMEEYRFWEHGYWNDILTKKRWKHGQPSLPYHSSSLFVVDLVELKHLASAEFLRATYQQLSSNDNNLANLDQDLPNLLQDRIPIHTLSQNWFWCEAWCADGDIQTAKTIDFCINPITNENTLSDTQEKIEEWYELNQIVEALDAQFCSDEYEKHIFHNYYMYI